MTFAEFTQTKSWKNIMAKVYGFGASIVLLGALFKIQHWKGAGPMLIVGLLTEAFIFAISAFEPIHEEVDWSLVYPQLAGLEPEDVPTKVTATGPTTQVSIFDQKLLESAENAPELFQKLTAGLQSLSNTASNLADISDATLATNKYSDSMNSAANAVNQFTSDYKQATENVSYAVGSLSDTYSKVGQKVEASVEQVESAYQKLIDSMTVEVDFSAVTAGNESYNEKIAVLNKNLSALNAIFELQLEGGLDKMMDDLKGAVEESSKYRSEIAQLADRASALNAVYGNMLSAIKA